MLEPAIGGITGTHGRATLTELQTTSVLDNQVTSFLNSQSGYTTSKPKAFVNWVLFDEQFKYVAASSGFEQVGADNTLTTHTPAAINISKGGYLYIYLSNETPNIDVFFDNLQITHIRGPILEETHYYPFGLTMAGISSKALAFGQPENKMKFNGIEQNNDFDLNMYDAFYRNLDPQIGRFLQPDPKPTNEISLYGAMNNNPIKFADPLGDTLRFPGASEEFKEMFNLASDHLTKKGVGMLLKSAQKMKGDLNIVETDEGTSYFDMETNTVYWDPLAAGVYTNNDDNSQVILSPAAVLNHELDHGVEHVKNPEKVEKLKGTKDDKYDNKEERRVITGSEQKTARALGHTKKSQVTRKDHGGGTRRVSSPLATDDVVGDKIKELLDQQLKNKEKTKQ